MAGDTHDFEYYQEKISSDNRERVMHHFVNGGGGAYLSIGTALDFPAPPPGEDWAFYPKTDRLRAKMDAETPAWKQPFWYWIKLAKAWPFSVEALSGLFDFNHAPFFQSFMEVRVERSKSRVVLILNGVSMVLCAGRTCKPTARPYGPGPRLTMRWNSPCPWTMITPGELGDVGGAAATTKNAQSQVTHRLHLFRNHLRLNR